MGYSETTARLFIQHIAPIIQSEAKKRGYAVCSTVIAQAIVEGAAGTSVLARDYHNHFGIKSGKSWLSAGRPSVNMKTKEEYTVGNITSINDYFRVYASDQEGVKGYYDFISSPRYSGGAPNYFEGDLRTAKNYIEYAERLKMDGYATSSTYVKTLTNTVKKYGLYIYDEGCEVEQEETINGYVVGRTYTTHSNLYIRLAPQGDKLEPKSLTTNAQLNAYEDEEGFAVLKRGSRVTCKSVQVVGNETWLQIPSGYVCAKQGDKTYIL